jgi:hypothetical protein
MDIPAVVCPRRRHGRSDGLTSDQDLMSRANQHPVQNLMVKNLGLSLDPPLPLVNVAPVDSPTLFQDNLCRHCDAFKLFDSLWILWYPASSFWESACGFWERLSNSSFQGAVTPLYKDRRGTKSKTAQVGCETIATRTTNTRNHSGMVSRWP